MNGQTNTSDTNTRHGRAVREPHDGERDKLVRKGDAGKLVVRCPRCRLNVKIDREEIPAE